MKTIEERAELRSEGYEDDGYSAGLYMGYVDGATEQKAIDIDKACEWLNENARHLLSAEMRRKFRKAMEK